MSIVEKYNGKDTVKMNKKEIKELLDMIQDEIKVINYFLDSGYVCNAKDHIRYIDNKIKETLGLKSPFVQST